MMLAHQLQTPTAGKLTARLQLTDTDFSKRFKAHCKAKINQIRAIGHMETNKQVLRDTWTAKALDVVEVVLIRSKL